jgi:hypothetical protein
MSSDNTSRGAMEASPTRSLWDNPRSTWKEQLPEREHFRDPNVTDAALREAVLKDDKQTLEFATPITAEALTFTFG